MQCESTRAWWQFLGDKSEIRAPVGAVAEVPRPLFAIWRTTAFRHGETTASFDQAHTPRSGEKLQEGPAEGPATMLTRKPQPGSRTKETTTRLTDRCLNLLGLTLTGNKRQQASTVTKNSLHSQRHCSTRRLGGPRRTLLQTKTCPLRQPRHPSPPSSSAESIDRTAQNPSSLQRSSPEPKRALPRPCSDHRAVNQSHGPRTKWKHHISVTTAPCLERLSIHPPKTRIPRKCRPEQRPIPRAHLRYRAAFRLERLCLFLKRPPEHRLPPDEPSACCNNGLPRLRDSTLDSRGHPSRDRRSRQLPRHHRNHPQRHRLGKHAAVREIFPRPPDFQRLAVTFWQQHHPWPINRRFHEPRLRWIRGDVCDLVDDVLVRGELQAMVLLGRPEVVPLPLCSVKRLCDRSVKLSGEVGQCPSNIGEHDVVMIRHHAHRMDQNAGLHRRPGKAIKKYLVGLSGRAKSEGALVATPREHARDERADRSREGHARFNAATAPRWNLRISGTFVRCWGGEVSRRSGGRHLGQ
jgi:hypothetical protein